MIKKIIGGLVIIIVIVAGVYLALARPWQGQTPKPDINTGVNAPKLFAKDDYTIEEVNGEKYIAVAKVGLRAKVPLGWTISIEGDDFPEPEYWVNSCSPDANIKTILVEG